MFFDTLFLMLVFMFFFGLFKFCYVHKHLLMTLLSLEYLILLNYMILFIYLGSFSLSYYFILVFLTFIVCESVIGLSILVVFIRSHGNDMIKGISFLLW